MKEKEKAKEKEKEKIDTISEHRLKHSYWVKPHVESDGSIWCMICGARLKRDNE